MLFILLRDNLSSGFEKPSLKERIIQVNQKNELEEMNVEKFKGMINDFKVIQEYVEETKQAISGIHKVSKVAKIRNRYNQVPHLTQDTNGKVTNSQKTPQTRAKRPALSQQVKS